MTVLTRSERPSNCNTAARRSGRSCPSTACCASSQPIVSQPRRPGLALTQAADRLVNLRRAHQLVVRNQLGSASQVRTQLSFFVARDGRLLLFPRLALAQRVHLLSHQPPFGEHYASVVGLLALATTDCFASWLPPEPVAMRHPQALPGGDDGWARGKS